MRTLRSASGRRDRPGRGVPVERRTRRDLLTAAVITVVLVVVAVIVLLNGSAARSEFATADEAQPEYGPALEAPTSLRPLWSHASAGSGAPLTTGGNLVTVTPDGRLVGRDAGSGAEQWSYTHAGRLCDAAYFSDSLVAAFDGASGCSDVTALDPTTQEYASTRQSAFPETMELIGTWDHMLALSPERLEIWRNDLVRTVEYGAVTAPQESGMQPRSGCTLGTADLTDERFAVAERCPTDESVRLTVSDTVPEDNRKPEEIVSGETGADGLWILDVSDDGVLALARSGDEWTVEWLATPTESATVMELDAAPTRMPSTETRASDNLQVRWFDGTSTHAFDTASGAHLWSTGGTTGPGHTGGYSPDPEAQTGRDWVILPVPGGFIVGDHATGAQTTHLSATSAKGEGVTSLSQVGDILYERRAGAVHAYKLSA